MTDPAWSDVLLELLGAWPGRFDEMMATAYVHSLQARGADDPEVALRALRSVVSEHPPSAATLAALARRDGQADPPAFEEVVAYVARTLASFTRYGDEALAAYVALVAEDLHEAPARWIAGLGMKGLRAIPEPVGPAERAQWRDHARGYAEACEAWRAEPETGVAVQMAVRRDALAGREVPPVLRPRAGLRQIEGGR